MLPSHERKYQKHTMATSPTPNKISSQPTPRQRLCHQVKKQHSNVPRSKVAQLVIGLVTKKNKEYFKSQERERLLSHQQQRDSYWTRQEKDDAGESTQYETAMKNQINAGLDRMGATQSQPELMGNLTCKGQKQGKDGDKYGNQPLRLFSPPGGYFPSIAPRTQARAKRGDMGDSLKGQGQKKDNNTVRTSFFIEGDRNSNFISIDINKNINRFFDQPLSDPFDGQSMEYQMSQIRDKPKLGQPMNFTIRNDIMQSFHDELNMADLPGPAISKPKDVKNLAPIRYTKIDDQLLGVTTGQKFQGQSTIRELKKSTPFSRSKTFVTPMKRDCYIIDGKYDLLEILKMKSPFAELTEKVAYQWMPSASLDTFFYEWSYQSMKVDPLTNMPWSPYDDQMGLIMEMNYARYLQLVDQEADEDTLNKYRVIKVNPYEIVNVGTQLVTYVNKDDPEDIQTKRLLRGKKLKKNRGTYSPRYQSMEEFSLKFNDNNKVAWLAKEYQKIKRSVENDYGLPSWKSVLEGIQIEEIHQIARNFPDIKEEDKLEMMLMRCKFWEALIRLMYLPFEVEEVLFIENLKYPLNYVVKSIMKIFSLETWLYSAVNKASRERDRSKIETLGPVACILSHALLLAAKSRNEYPKTFPGELTPPIQLYRCFHLKPNQKQIHYKWRKMKNKNVRMHGYVNCLPNRDKAMQQILAIKEDMDSVIVFELCLLKEVNQGCHFFHLATNSFSMYADEDQFIIDDGIPFKVTAVECENLNETILTTVTLQSAPFTSNYIDKEYLHQNTQKRIENQIENSRNKRNNSPFGYSRTLAPLDLGVNVQSLDESTVGPEGTWDYDQQQQLKMQSFHTNPLKNNLEQVQQSTTDQLNMTSADVDKYDSNTVNQTISTQNQTTQFLTARILANNNVINQDMSISMIDDSLGPPNKSLIMNSQEVREDEDDNSMTQQLSLSQMMPLSNRKLRGRKKLIPVQALEGNSTINSSNAFLMEESIIKDVTQKKVDLDKDLESLFTNDSKDLIVQKIKDKQMNDKGFWWRDQFGQVTAERQPFYLKDQAPNPKLLPVKQMISKLQKQQNSSLPRAGADEMVNLVDKLYMDQMTIRKNKRGKRAGKSVGSSVNTTKLESFHSKGQRKQSLKQDDRPKLLKPMRKTLLNSELMMDQIKNLSYSEKDTYDYWIKEIEESEELKQQYMELFGIQDEEINDEEKEKEAQKAYQLEMEQERPNLHGSVLIRLLLNAFRINSLQEAGISSEQQQFEYDEKLDTKNQKKEFMKKLAKLSKILKTLKKQRDQKEEEEKQLILKKVMSKREPPKRHRNKREAQLAEYIYSQVISQEKKEVEPQDLEDLKEFIDIPENSIGETVDEILERIDAKRRSSKMSGLKQKVPFELPREPEFKGDYLGPKLPSLLEYLENQIHLREVKGMSQVPVSARAPPHVPHKTPKVVLQEESFFKIMKEKDSIHKNVKFESDDLTSRKFQPLVDRDCRQTLHRLMRNEDKMNKSIHKAVLEKTVKRMEQL